MKLSEILRYMLYNSNTEKVLLEKEITYIRSFIELQQLRLSTPNFIKLDVQGSVEGKLIPPMLLITFVENAFKHGSKNIPAPGIIIAIHCIDDEFTFEITSYIANGQMQNKDPHKGIGLQNVKRRLELLYPGRHDLLVGYGEDKFYVKLRIDEL
jgi:two-component system, LytTR family, sensor kinase